MWTQPFYYCIEAVLVTGEKMHISDLGTRKESFAKFPSLAHLAIDKWFEGNEEPFVTDSEPCFSGAVLGTFLKFCRLLLR